MKIKFNREEVTNLVGKIKEGRLKKIEIKLEQRGDTLYLALARPEGDSGILFSDTIVNIANKVLLIPNKYNEYELIYDKIVGESRKKLEDLIYYDLREKINVIKELGYLASRETLVMINLINESILKSFKIADYTSINYGHIEGVTERIVDLYIQEEDPWFSRVIQNHWGTRRFILKRRESILETVHQSILSKGDENRNDILEVQKTISNSIKNKTKLYRDGICEGVKDLRIKRGYRDEVINEGLRNYLYELNSTLNGNTIIRLKKHLEGLERYVKDYKKGVYLTRLKPVLNPKTRKPYILVEGELEKYTYEMVRGNYGYYRDFTEMAGVTKVGENKYIVTLKAFDKFEEDDKFYQDLKFAEFAKGDWETLYEVDGKLYTTVNKYFADSVNRNGEFREITFNVGKEKETMFGMKLVMFNRVFMGENSGYELIDDDDDKKELLDEIYNKLDREGVFTRKYREWLVGYKIRNTELSEDKITQMKQDEEELESIYHEIEESVIAQLNKRYDTTMSSYRDLVDLDGKMGLDSGFVFVSYVNEVDEFIRNEYNKRVVEEKGYDNTLHFNNCYPRVQSLTIKTPIVRSVIEIFNGKHPNRRLKVRTVLD